MADSPATRASLLVRLRDANDAEAWRDFVRLYGPLVYEFGQRKGLQDADAANLMQEVLHAVRLPLGLIQPRQRPVHALHSAVTLSRQHDDGRAPLHL